MSPYVVVAIDPGSDKCGLSAVRLSEDGSMQVLARKVIQVAQVAEEVAALSEQCSPDFAIVGAGTGSREVVRAIATRLPDMGVLVVDEKHSTERARKRYWELSPPRGWRRLVPRGLLVPPEPLDDIAAIILAEDVLHEALRPNAESKGVDKN